MEPAWAPTLTARLRHRASGFLCHQPVFPAFLKHCLFLTSLSVSHFPLLRGPPFRIPSSHSLGAKEPHSLPRTSCRQGADTHPGPPFASTPKAGSARRPWDRRCLWERPAPGGKFGAPRFCLAWFFLLLLAYQTQHPLFSTNIL